MTRSKYFWPLFATGLFFTKVGIIALVIYVALTKASPLEGPDLTLVAPASAASSTAGGLNVREESAP